MSGNTYVIGPGLAKAWVGQELTEENVESFLPNILSRIPKEEQNVTLKFKDTQGNIFFTLSPDSEGKLVPTGETHKKKQYPSIWKQAKNLATTATTAAKDAVQGKPILASEEVKKSRYDTCSACSSFDKEEGRCTECGCFMSVKTGLLSAKCPLDKWEE